MEMKVSNEFYNPLLRRKEIKVEIDHKGEGTPERFDVRKHLASKLGTKIENVFVMALEASTGLDKTVCLLQVYDDPRTASSTVPEHIVVRNSPSEERAKAKEAKAKKREKTAKPPGKTETKPVKPSEPTPAAKSGSEPSRPK